MAEKQINRPKMRKYIKKTQSISTSPEKLAVILRGWEKLGSKKTNEGRDWKQLILLDIYIGIPWL